MLTGRRRWPRGSKCSEVPAIPFWIASLIVTAAVIDVKWLHQELSPGSPRVLAMSVGVIIREVEPDPRARLLPLIIRS